MEGKHPAGKNLEWKRPSGERSGGEQSVRGKIRRGTIREGKIPRGTGRRGNFRRGMYRSPLIQHLFGLGSPNVVYTFLPIFSRRKFFILANFDFFPSKNLVFEGKIFFPFTSPDLIQNLFELASPNLVHTFLPIFSR